MGACPAATLAARPELEPACPRCSSPSLTRIEMPDDWVGHPQRKDYPLGGIPVEYKGAQIPPPDERRGYN